MNDVIGGIMLPFIGTSLGAACVFPMRRQLGDTVQRVLAGFAAGVMTAASIWSLLIPSIEQSEKRLGRLAFFPAASGLLAGVLFMLTLGAVTDRLCSDGRTAHKLPRNTMLLLAVTLHNIPEGMAVGAAYAGVLCGEGGGLTAAAALALAAGIAIQNFPEGAIISMPLKAEGMTRRRAFAAGVLSGAVEPLGAAVTILAAGLIAPVMPYLLGFAAGAMLHVTAAELLPETVEPSSPAVGALSCTGGFLVMMILDVMLG